MDTTTELARTIGSLPFEERKKVYQLNYSVGYIGSGDLNDRLVLISLVALAYQKLAVKDVTITPLKLLLKITGEKDTTSRFYVFLESLAILVEDISYGIKKIDSCGMQTSQDIIKKIKELLNTWIPF